MSNMNQFYQNTLNNYSNNNNQPQNVYPNNFFLNQNNYKNFYNQNTNFKYQTHIQNYSPDLLKGEYTQLKNLEHDNPTLIKERILQYEKQIVIPIYQQINKQNILKKQLYIDLYNKYKKIIYDIIKKIRYK